VFDPHNCGAAPAVYSGGLLGSEYVDISVTTQADVFANRQGVVNIPVTTPQ
jgi:hypothetical protein